MSEFRPEEGNFELGDVRIAVIAARWNAEITDGLLAAHKTARPNAAQRRPLFAWGDPPFVDLGQTP